MRPVVAAYRLPQEHFQTVIDGMAMDLERNRYLDFADLERYRHCVAGVVGLMSAEIFGYANPGDAALRAGPGDRVPTDQHHSRRRRGRARGRIYLPQDELARHGVSAASILKREATPAMVPLMEEQVARARAGTGARSIRFPSRIAARSVRGSSWPPSTAQCWTRSSAKATKSWTIGSP